MASNSHLSYDDVREALDRALASNKGVRIYESTPGRLISLRQRIHKLKSLDRMRSRRIYPPEHQSYNTSAYDKLSVLTSEAVVKAEPPKGFSKGTPEFREANLAALNALPKGELYIEIVKRQPGMLQIEELT